MCIRDRHWERILHVNLWGVIHGSRRGHLPSFWKVIGATLRYFRPGYTPHHEGSTEQALAYLARSPAAQAAAHGGNWGTTKGA